MSDPAANSQKNRVAALRADLVISVVERHGRKIAVIKDPIAHRFYEFENTDFEWARLLTPEIPLKRLVAQVRENCLRFALEWTTRRSQGDRFESRRKCVRMVWRKECLRQAPPRLRMKLECASGSNGSAKYLPSYFCALDYWTQPRFSIAPKPGLDFVSPPGSLACRIFFLLSTGVFVWNGGFSQFEPGWFASASGLGAFYVGLVLLKTLHEAAHAVAVRHAGGSVHEAGMMLVAGLPLFYVEASDSYLFPKKEQRIAVSAAGIVAELFFASILVWLWLPMAEGFARQLLLNLILIASVSTVLFNGNPLMRFDGYYILADFLEMPGLRQRSRQFIGKLVAAAVLGTKRMTVSRREAWILGLYGVCSYIYLLCVILGIWRFLSVTLGPYGLKWIAHILIGSWALGSLVFPLLGFVKELVFSAAQSDAGRKRRAMIVTAAALGCVVLFLSIPIPYWVERSCALEASEAVVVRAQEPGFVTEVLVEEGQTVSKGEPLAVLSNREIESSRLKAHSKLQEAQAKLHFSIAQGSANEVGSAKNAISTSQTRLKSLEDRSERLILKAPAGGIIGSRQLETLVGRKLKPGEIFCVIRPQVLSEFLIPLREKEARIVKKGDAVRLRVLAFADRSYQGVVVGDPLRMKPRDLPGGIKNSGDIARNSSGALLEDTHFAVVLVNDPDKALKIGMTGRVRILCGSRSIGSTIWDQLTDFIRLDLRMR